MMLTNSEIDSIADVPVEFWTDEEGFVTITSVDLRQLCAQAKIPNDAPPALPGVDAVLGMVVGVRKMIERSPGLSSAPFSDNGWSIIESALRAALPSRADVIEECAKVCDAEAAKYRKTKTDADGNVAPEAEEAKELAYCCELNAKAIRAIGKP